MNIIEYDLVESKIITVRNLNVIIDSDVANLYGVDTKRVNEAVSRNPEKFPDGYVVELTAIEKAEVVANCDHLQKLKFSPNTPSAFTEKGLYMLATILKSPIATKTTIAIIEAFSEIKNLATTAYSLAKADNERQKTDALKAGTEIVANLLNNDLLVKRTETSFEINLPLFKFKHTVKKGSR